MAPSNPDWPFRGELLMLLRRIFANCEGSVAPIAALAIIPIIGAISAAVDYSRANLARSAMQSALDSTALMLAKEAQTLSPAEINAKANSYFTAMFRLKISEEVRVCILAI